jgi:hypothetical protein
MRAQIFRPDKSNWWLLAGILTLFLFFSFGRLSSQVASQPEEAAFQAIKLLIFDEKWAEAVERLDAFLKQYPSSPLAAQAVFYRGRCLAQIPGRSEEAITAYESYLQLKSPSPSLAEEAELAVIDLASELVAKGKRGYINQIESRLSSANRVVRYYAAFKLSYFKEKSLAQKSLPVLKEIIQEEKDAELKDRARIALLRVSPESLSQLEEQSSLRKPLVLKIRVEKKGKKEPEIFITIPWSLADLALRAIPEKDKEKLRQQGYDIERIIKDLSRNQGQIIEIRDAETIIKIWIE